MRGWYRAAVDHALPPAQVTLKRITSGTILHRTPLPPPGGGEHPNIHDARPHQ